MAVGDNELPVVYPYAKDKDNLLQRLKRIEGQVRGVHRMIDEGRYCVDILTQVAAVRAALHQVELALLEGHTRGCVAGAIQRGAGEEAVSELMEVLRKLT